jgi:transglutaminase-like putative cysteine protease
MKRLRLLHVTEFTYEGPVSESYNQVHLQPQDDEWQNCVSFRLNTQPASTPAVHLDYFGNRVHRFNVMMPHRRLRIEAQSIVVLGGVPPAPAGGPPLATLPKLRDSLAEEHWDFLGPSTYVPAEAAVGRLGAEAEAESDGSVGGFARTVAALIRSTFRYEKGATHVHSSIADVLSTKAGVCQDFSHLFLAIARGRGIPARYVSGYFVPAPDERREAEQVSGGLASHAWVEAFVPDAGWLGLDPTHGGEVGRQHVRIAYGRDYADVAPVRGVHRGSGGQRLSVDVRVRPALDDEGREHVREGGPAPAAPAPEQPQQ